MDAKLLALMSTISPMISAPLVRNQLAQQKAGATTAAPAVSSNPNPMAAISSRYTSQQGSDSGLAPMAMYQAAKRGPSVAQGGGVGGK